MIGLHRQQLAIVEANPRWVALFETERQAIATALGSMALRIEHIGSTSVPELPAKPIIDIGVLVDRVEGINVLRSRLPSIGYIDRGDKGAQGGYLFVREQGKDHRTHHLHVVVRGDLAWDRYIRFRDALRTNPDLRQQYAALKHKLRNQLGNDRRGYAESKAAFVNNALEIG